MAGESRAHTIKVQGGGREYAGLGSGTLTPGYLVEPTATADTWQAHGNTGQPIPVAVVREQFENDGAGIEDTIPTGDSITVWLPEKGSVVLCVTASTIARGQFVASAGNGQVEVADSELAFGVAIDDTYDHGALLRVAVLVN